MKHKKVTALEMALRAARGDDGLGLTTGKLTMTCSKGECPFFQVQFGVDESVAHAVNSSAHPDRGHPTWSWVPAVLSCPSCKTKLTFVGFIKGRSLG